MIYRHPENPNVGITIALSQRSKPEDPAKGFKELTNEFIKSAEFKSFNNK